MASHVPLTGQHRRLALIAVAAMRFPVVNDCFVMYCFSRKNALRHYPGVRYFGRPNWCEPQRPARRLSHGRERV